MLFTSCQSKNCQSSLIRSVDSFPLLAGFWSQPGTGPDPRDSSGKETRIRSHSASQRNCFHFAEEEDEEKAENQETPEC